MKLILFLILPFFILFSCHTPKNSIQSKKIDQQAKVDQKINQHNDIADTKSDKTDASKSIKDHSEGFYEKTTSTKTYDPNKPIDPSTGKPPLVSESVTTDRNSGKSDTQTDIGVTVKKEDTHKDNSKTETTTNGQLNTSEQNKTKEKVKPPAVAYWFYILVIIIIGAIGIIIYKNWKRIKTLFSSIKFW
jgi:hypothetical protein